MLFAFPNNGLLMASSVESTAPPFDPGEDDPIVGDDACDVGTDLADDPASFVAETMGQEAVGTASAAGFQDLSMADAAEGDFDEDLTGLEARAVGQPRHMVGRGLLEEEAAEVFKFLSPKEAQKLGAAMAALKNVTRERIDEALAEHNAALPRLEEFILPAGTRAASLAHVCRTVARRAERSVVALGAVEDVKETPRHYLNRLSDLMFVLARVLNRMNGGDDVYWKSERLARGREEG